MVASCLQSPFGLPEHTSGAHESGAMPWRRQVCTIPTDKGRKEVLTHHQRGLMDKAPEARAVGCRASGLHPEEAESGSAAEEHWSSQR